MKIEYTLSFENTIWHENNTKLSPEISLPLCEKIASKIGSNRKVDKN